MTLSSVIIIRNQSQTKDEKKTFITKCTLASFTLFNKKFCQKILVEL